MQGAVVGYIYYSFLVLYTFLNSAYIVLIVLPYRVATVYYYLVLVMGLFILNTLMPYLGAICTVLDLNKSCPEMALKI
jgi:hypothetical protein